MRWFEVTILSVALTLLTLPVVVAAGSFGSLIYN